MLRVWGRPSAYNVQKVIWFLEEIGVGYEFINIGGSLGGLDSEEFLSMNPNGTTPVIEDDGFCVWESNTIVRYLAAKFGKDEYFANSASDRTLVEQWMDWELSTLQPAILSLFWGYFRTPKDQRNSKKIEHFTKKCERAFAILDSQLESNLYVTGRNFSLADITLGISIYRYFNMGITTPSLPNVSSWYERLTTRAAYQKTVMISLEELRGRMKP